MIAPAWRSRLSVPPAAAGALVDQAEVLFANWPLRRLLGKLLRKWSQLPGPGKMFRPTSSTLVSRMKGQRKDRGPVAGRNAGNVGNHLNQRDSMTLARCQSLVWSVSCTTPSLARLEVRRRQDMGHEVGCAVRRPETYKKQICKQRGLSNSSDASSDAFGLLAHGAWTEISPQAVPAFRHDRVGLATTSTSVPKQFWHASWQHAPKFQTITLLQS